MRVSRSCFIAAALAALAAGCGSPQAAPAGAPDAVAVASNTAAQVPGPGTPAIAEPTGFTVEQVPESAASLPPFPMFAVPDGLTSILDDGDKDIGFDRQHVIAGDRIVAVEGRVFHDAFQLQPREGRRYSEIEFRRNYENAITALGGAKISTVQFTGPVVTAFGGREAVEEHFLGACVARGCAIDTYLIRSAGKEYWINVSTGRIPLHGYVTVLERQAMKQSLGYLSADEMKAALDARGRVALYINFDFDRATLRPDATPAVEEIARLLRADPALRLSIEGHTDNVGAAARNRTLSAERAEAVRAGLVARGVAADRLTTRGMGADHPLADNSDEAGRAKNRRVELVKVA